MFVSYKLLVRVSQTSKLLEAYMIVNFKTRVINRNTCKLALISMLIKKITEVSILLLYYLTENLKLKKTQNQIQNVGYSSILSLGRMLD